MTTTTAPEVNQPSEVRKSRFWAPAARVTTETSKIDQVLKSVTGIMGVWDAKLDKFFPNHFSEFSALPETFRNTYNLFKGVTDVTKGTKIITLLNKRLSEEYKKYHTFKKISHFFQIVVGCFETVGLTRKIFGFSGLSDNAKLAKDTNFIAAFTFGSANAMVQLRKARAKKKQAKEHLTKWQVRSDGDDQALIEHYQRKCGDIQDSDLSASSRRALCNMRIRALSSNENSYVRENVRNKVTLWKNAVKEENDNCRSEWADLAKNINKFVQLIVSMAFTLAFAAIGVATATTALVVADVSVKVVLALVGMTALIWEECKANRTANILPNGYQQKMRQWTQNIT